jgi:hypothetical protein
MPGNEAENLKNLLGLSKAQDGTDSGTENILINFCRNCGNKIASDTEICKICGVRPLLERNYCQNCGARTQTNQELCIKCGFRLLTLGTTQIPSSNEKNLILSTSDKTGQLVKKRGLRVIATIFGALILLIVLCRIGNVDQLADESMERWLRAYVETKLFGDVVDWQADITIDKGLRTYRGWYKYTEDWSPEIIRIKDFCIEMYKVDNEWELKEISIDDGYVYH